MDNKKQMGYRLSAALALRNMKQKDLADVLKVTPNTISYFCSGRRTPSISQIVEISKRLDVSTDYLLGTSETPSTNPEIQNTVDLTGLCESSIEQIVWLKQLGEPLGVLDLLLSDPSMPSFILAMYHHCRANQEYFAAAEQRRVEIERLQHATGGDLVKEIQLREAGAISVTYTRLDIDQLKDAADLKEYKLTRRFSQLMNRIAATYCERYTPSVDNNSEEE